MSLNLPDTLSGVKEKLAGRLPKVDRPKLPGKKGDKKKRIALAAAAVAVIAAGFGVYRLFFAQEERIAVTGTTTYGALNEAIQGSGTTTPADSVTYEITGKVLEWNVEAGQEVKAGDLLYVLDSSDAEDEMLEYEVDLEDLYEQRADIQESIANQQVTAPFSGRIEDIQVEAGDDVQTGMTLATLVDDSAMKATLYFSYSYEDEMYVGMPVTLSVPDQMLTLDGTVTDIRYVDYTTAEGMKCFAVTVEAENPGSLTEGATATCWAQGSGGTELYAVSDAQLEFAHSATLTAETSGEVTAVYPVDYQRVSAGETLFVIDASGYETQLETVEKQIENYEKNIADLQEEIDTEYTRYADIDGTVVTAEYATNRMTGEDVGSVVVYNQESMEISVNVDELDVDYLEVGMPVTVVPLHLLRRGVLPGGVDLPESGGHLRLQRGVHLRRHHHHHPPGGGGVRPVLRRDGVLLHRHRGRGGDRRDRPGPPQRPVYLRRRLLSPGPGGQPAGQRHRPGGGGRQRHRLSQGLLRRPGGSGGL